MQAVLYVIARTAQLLLGLVEVAMLLRMILSWFVRDEGNRFLFFLVVMTEPFIFPFRLLLGIFGLPDDLPLDIPFTVSFIVLSIVNGVLPVLVY